MRVTCAEGSNPAPVPASWARISEAATVPLPESWTDRLVPLPVEGFGKDVTLAAVRAAAVPLGSWPQARAPFT